MNRRWKTIAIGFLAALVLAVAAPAPGSALTALAGTARIAFSDPSVTVGQEFQVSVKITTQDGTLGASDVMLSYDPACIEFVSGENASGGAGSVRLVGTMDSSTTTQFSYSLRFKALQAGNTSITVGSYEVYDVDAQSVDVTQVGSSAIKVNAPATYSSDASLSSLTVSPGTLSPAFSPDVTSYTVQVGSDVEKLAVSANVSDSGARVVVNGNSGLTIGENTVTCRVTAEDGQTTKDYTITVTKLETTEVPSQDAGALQTGAAVMGDQTAEVDGVTYTVASSFDAAILPEGYTQSTCTYGGAEVMCGVGNDLTLIYLQDGSGAGSLYIYVPETGALSPYVTIDVTAKSILVLPPDDSVAIPAGFARTTIQLNGNYKVQGWVWQSDEEQRYCVVYGMNENGEKGLYRYDIGEKTFQRYFEDPSLATQYDDAQVEELLNQYNSLCEDYNIRLIVIIALIVICLVLFLIVVNLLLHRRSRGGESRPQVRTQPSGNRERMEVRTNRLPRGETERADGRRPGKGPARDDRVFAENAAKAAGRTERRAGDERDVANRRHAVQTYDLRRGSVAEAGQNASAARAERYGAAAEESYRRGGRPERAGAERHDGGRYGREDGAYQAYREERYGRSSRPAYEDRDEADGLNGAYREERYAQSSRQAEAERYGSGRRTGEEAERYGSGRQTGAEAERYRSSRPAREEAERYESGRYAKNETDRYGSGSFAPEDGRFGRNGGRETRREFDAGMEEAIRQRELERARRARQARERLEREREEDARRARQAASRETAAARETQSSRRPAAGGKNSSPSDDFEWIDLNE